MPCSSIHWNNDGHFSLLIGNFANQMIALYGNQGHGLFIDSSQPAGVGQPSLLSLVFGCFFVDVDNAHPNPRLRPRWAASARFSEIVIDAAVPENGFWKTRPMNFARLRSGFPVGVRPPTKFKGMVT